MSMSQAMAIIYLCEVNKLIKRTTRGNDLNKLTISECELRVLYLTHPDLSYSLNRQFNETEVATIVDVSVSTVRDIMAKLKKTLPPSLVAGLY